jgi:predicted DCC family thiol-disulfide oxidoreductase YuxK
MSPDKRIILYDGVCGLCNRFNRYVLKRDRNDQFRFASLQSSFAEDLLARHGQNAADLDTLYLVVEPDTPAERVLSKGPAITAILSDLGGASRSLSTLLRALPMGLLNWGYDLIVRHRYRVFGKYSACPLPEPGYKDKFIEI